MITDGERRAVAEILRKTRVERYNSILNGIHLGEIVGVGAQIVSPHEDQVRAAADRLADLIEPVDSGSAEGAGSGVPKCDRDALLELADEMDEVAQRRRLMGYAGFAIGDEDRARRIREALGVGK